MAKRHFRRRTVVITLTVVLTTAIGAIAAVMFLDWYYSVEQRFARSLTAFEAYAAQVAGLPATSPLPPLPKPFGEFEACDAERLPHGFQFYCDYGHWLDAKGFAYSTQPLPPVVDDQYHYTPLRGNWYKVWRN